MTSSRTFTHKDGFMDDTSYMLVKPNGNVYRITKKGKKILSKSWGLEGCLDAVASGHWVETVQSPPPPRTKYLKDVCVGEIFTLNAPCAQYRNYCYNIALGKNQEGVKVLTFDSCCMGMMMFLKFNTYKCLFFIVEPPNVQISVENP